MKRRQRRHRPRRPRRMRRVSRTRKRPTATEHMMYQRVATLATRDAAASSHRHCSRERTRVVSRVVSCIYQNQDVCQSQKFCDSGFAKGVSMLSHVSSAVTGRWPARQIANRREPRSQTRDAQNASMMSWTTTTMTTTTMMLMTMTTMMKMKMTILMVFLIRDRVVCARCATPRSARWQTTAAMRARRSHRTRSPIVQCRYRCYQHNPCDQLRTISTTTTRMM